MSIIPCFAGGRDINRQFDTWFQLTANRSVTQFWWNTMRSSTDLWSLEEHDEVLQLISPNTQCLRLRQSNLMQQGDCVQVAIGDLWSDICRSVTDSFVMRADSGIRREWTLSQPSTAFLKGSRMVCKRVGACITHSQCFQPSHGHCAAAWWFSCG